MIENRRQLENTRIKLRELQELYTAKEQEVSDDHVRALTMGSLKKRINQFKEEIARFESHANSVAPSS